MNSSDNIENVFVLRNRKVCWRYTQKIRYIVINSGIWPRLGRDYATGKFEQLGDTEKCDAIGKLLATKLKHPYGVEIVNFCY